MKAAWSIVFRLASRTLRRRRLSAALLLTVLSLGAGIPAAVFSAALVVASPFDTDQSQAFRIYGVTPTSTELNLSPPDFYDLRSATTGVETLAAVTPFAPEFTLTGRDEPRVIVARRASAGFFRVLRAPLLAGREFTLQDETPGVRTVIVGERLWRDALKSEPDAVGQSLLLNGVPHTIVGIVASHQEVLGRADVWIPIQYSATLRGFRLLAVVGRIKPNRDLSDASVELRVLAAPFRAQYPTTHDQADVRVLALEDAVAGPLREQMWLMTACAFALWLLTALVAAGFALAGAIQLRHQMAIARAVGGSPLQLWVSSVAPHALLIAISLPFAVAATMWTLGITQSANLLALPRPASTLAATGVATVLLLLILLAMAVAVTLVPPLERPDSVRGVGRSTARAQGFVVAAESACAVVLVAVASALAWGAITVASRDPGFTPDGRLYARLTIPNANNTPPAARWRALETAVASIPGVSAIALTTELPHSGQDNPAPFSVDGRQGRSITAGVRAVSPSYPSVAGLRLLQGRPLDVSDDAQRPRVALVNRRLARELFGSDSVIGRAVAVSVTQPPMTLEIVGVVSDVRHASMWSEPSPEIYAPLSQVALPSATLLLSTSSPPATLQSALTRAVRAAEPDMAVPMLADWSDAVRARVLPHQRRASFAGLLALTGIVLVSISLYALITQAFEEQKRELVLRLALGCSPARARRSILTKAVVLALAGAGPGLFASIPAARMAGGAIGPSAGTIALASAAAALLLLLVAAVLGAWRPARDVTRLDPAAALRA